MKEKFKFIFKDKNCRVLLLTSLIFFILQIVVLLFFFKRLPREVPIFYSIPWGDGQLAPPFMLVIFPISSLFFLIINYFLSIITFNSDYFLPRIFYLFSMITSFFAFFGLWNIILLLV